MNELPQQNEISPVEKENEYPGIVNEVNDQHYPIQNTIPYENCCDKEEIADYRDGQSDELDNFRGALPDLSEFI